MASLLDNKELNFAWSLGPKWPHSRILSQYKTVYNFKILYFSSLGYLNIPENRSFKKTDHNCTTTLYVFSFQQSAVPSTASFGV
jgi:hypothetical protein